MSFPARFGYTREMRSAGILLHPTSLPSGKLDADAYSFVDWLAAAGQRWWQILPLGPPGEGGSPYVSPSAFAGSPRLLADPDAAVSAREERAFRERNAEWADAWAEHAGETALADQVRFEREWQALRAHARARGVSVLGDVPIYVAAGGADHRAHPELFAEGEVAGAPADPFSATGQLWGNPLYDWRANRAEGYRWWAERFRRTFELVDAARIDHFRGFVSYWAVPAGARTAEAGRWRRGPGEKLFRAVLLETGRLPLVAEDLGHVTPAVERLRDRLGLPGMVVLQFGFSGGAANPHRPENHRRHAVVYTGTHDHDTALGWWSRLSEEERRATGLLGIDPAWELCELALGSRAERAILPAQDVLGLGSEARMNTPGEPKGNWAWRLEAGRLDDALARRLAAETAAAGR